MSMSGGMVMSPLMEEVALTLMFVALGLGAIGIGFGRLREGSAFQLHRWIMTWAMAINLIVIFLVMFPSMFLFYTDPNVNAFSPFSILQLVHGVVGFPAVVLGLMYVTRDLPQNLKKWMKITAILWLATIAIGAVVYITMPS